MSDLPAVPDYFGQFVAPLQRQQALGIEQQNANLQQQQIVQQQQAMLAKARAQQQYQQDAAEVIANPTPDGFRALMLRHPEMHDSIKDTWSQVSDAQRASDVSAASQVYAALSNGRTDLAAQLLKDRKTAQAGAGTDDKVTDQLIDLVESGDPAKVKQAQGIAGFVLASSAGPDKIGPMLESLGSIGGNGKGQVVGRAIGHYENGEFKVDYRDPDAPQYRELEVTGADGQIHKAIVRVGGDGAPVAGGGGGQETALNHVFANEGGYNPKDANGSPTNFGINFKANKDTLAKMGITAANFKDMTKEQAAQIYATKYWPASGADKLPENLQAPYFDAYIRSPAIAKKAYAESGGDPVKFVQTASAAFQKMAGNPKSGTAPYAKAWANRDAKNLAIASGGNAAGQPQIAAMGAATGKPANEAPSSDMLDDAATQYLLTGQMPALGNGGAGLKQQILGRRSEIMRKIGITAEQLPAFQAQYAADKKALTDNSALLSGLQSSENALKANGQQVWNTHRTLVSDGIISDNPWMTRKRLSYYANFGSPDQKAHVKAYLDAVNAYSSEYTKFMTAANGMGGSAAPSDSARQLSGELNDPGLAATPLLAHLRQGITEATNKRNGVAQQNQALQGKLSSYLHPHTGSTSQAPSGAVQIHSAKEWYALKPGTRYIDPTGVTRTKK